MDFDKIIEMEKENLEFERVFLYVENGRLVAYEISAYVMQMLFPDLRMFSFQVPACPGVKEDREMLLKIVVPLEAVLGKSQDYPLLVSDNRAELTFADPSETRWGIWKKNFGIAKKVVNGSLSSVFRG